jgi:hypothetical protein
MVLMSSVNNIFGRLKCRIRFYQIFFVIFSFVLVFITPSIQAMTFDYYLRSYCPYGTNCGYSTWAEAEEALCRSVQEMNIEYEKAGISFRPTIFPNDFLAPNKIVNGLVIKAIPDAPPEKDQYSEISIRNACDGKTVEDGVLSKHWHDNVAAAFPQAISIMLDAGWSTCCSCIPRTFKPVNELFGLYCHVPGINDFYRYGTVYAHEMGHYWGLSHPFTFEDPANNSPLDLDGDDHIVYDSVTGLPDELPLVYDTPIDPDRFEFCDKYCGGDTSKDKCSNDAQCAPDSCERVCAVCNEQGCTWPKDEDVNGNPSDGHVWNEMVVNQGADMDSPHPTYCSLTYKYQLGSTTESVFPSLTYAHNAMSYYGQSCRGPVVVNGEIRDPFSQDQITRMHTVRQVISVRDASHLPDVCAGHGGDTDNDGICNEDDNCPFIANLCYQTESDGGDGFGDHCDNCPDDKNSDQKDIDTDEIGDVCDDDRDGDGCNNDVDQHPDDRYIAVGTKSVLAGTCGPDIEQITVYEDEAEHLDTDGKKNCIDCDDDGDGLCDPDIQGWLNADCNNCTGVDPCPIDPLNNCNNPLPLPGDIVNCPPPWLECVGGSCNAFFLKFARVINPDPTQELRFEMFQIWNETIYAATNKISRLTPSQQITQIKGIAESPVEGYSLQTASITEPEERLRLEIWRRATPLAGESLAAVVGEWPASRITIGDISRGRIIRLTPGLNEAGEPELRIAATWQVGIAEGKVLPDADSDNWPDFADNCVNVANLDQIDADNDAFGNRCDPDLDNNGVVTKSDVARVRACEGADLMMQIPFEGDDISDPVTNALTTKCRAADMNGDFKVDRNDTAIVESHLGEHINLAPSIKPLPLLRAQCIQPAFFQNTKIDVLHLKKSAGSKTIELKGEIQLPYPFTPALDPAKNGINLVIRTAQGRTLLDVLIPGSFDTEARSAWKISSEANGVHFVNLKGWYNIILNWGDKKLPGIVKVNMLAKDSNFVVNETELPLYAQMTLNNSIVATRQCAQTGFKFSPEQPNCSFESNLDKIRCSKSD